MVKWCYIIFHLHPYTIEHRSENWPKKACFFFMGNYLVREVAIPDLQSFINLKHRNLFVFLLVKINHNTYIA